ncbi:MAG TPA: S41 family peptidase [Thermoanaerobacterales bacterium]|nr:S41 family peptidase [Thermoanaerobacterales bacterium]
MKDCKARPLLKVAVLCIAVSLLSFFAGITLGKTSTYKDSGSEDIVAAAVTEESNMDHLKPISDVMELIKSKYIEDVDTEKLIEGAIKGMVDSLEEPYSVYMNQSQFRDFITSLDGAFGGVGIVLSTDENTGEIIVVSPIEGTPAHKAGILPRDIIVKVDDVDLTGKSLDDAVRLLRGEKGTQVTVYVKRGNNQELLKFQLTRDDIRVTTVNHEVLDDNIGYIKITSFDSKTYNEFRQTLDSLKAQGIKGLVLDLRNNPGGSLYESVMIADEILGKGIIVYTEDRNKNRLEEYFSDEEKISMPLVVLINENSASASEIVAGAIKDHKAGILVGTKTFGKGSVQEVQPFENKTGMKLTIAKYYLPSGRCIDGTGIEPDIEVKLDKETGIFNVPREKDKQLLKAIEILKSPE